MKVKKLRIKIKATLQGHSREFSVNLRSQSSEDPVVPDSVLSRRVPISREEKRIEERFVVEIGKKKEAFCFPCLLLSLVIFFISSAIKEIKKELTDIGERKISCGQCCERRMLHCICCNTERERRRGEMT